MAKTAKPGPGPARRPDHVVTFEPSPKRVRVRFNGETLADTTRALLVRETGRVPVYYFPQEDVATGFLERSARRTRCPYKGEAAYWTVAVGDRRAEDAVWSYETPCEDVAGLAGHMAFYWDRMDAWFEEDEEVFVHARDPYVRIDILASSRPVRVVLGGRAVAESRRALFLFETGLPTRYYLPPGDVESDLLRPSSTRTACPYKGTARYWSMEVGGRLFQDIIWSYPNPVPESARIEGYLCFFNERVDAILVDGVEVPKPRTKWSGA